MYSRGVFTDIQWGKTLFIPVYDVDHSKFPLKPQRRFIEVPHLFQRKKIVEIFLEGHSNRVVGIF
jgi:hypothetical protein